MFHLTQNLSTKNDELNDSGTIESTFLSLLYCQIYAVSIIFPGVLPKQEMVSKKYQVCCLEGKAAFFPDGDNHQ